MDPGAGKQRQEEWTAGCQDRTERVCVHSCVSRCISMMNRTLHGSALVSISSLLIATCAASISPPPPPPLPTPPPLWLCRTSFLDDQQLLALGRANGGEAAETAAVSERLFHGSSHGCACGWVGVFRCTVFSGMAGW